MANGKGRRRRFGAIRRFPPAAIRRATRGLTA